MSKIKIGDCVALRNGSLYKVIDMKKKFIVLFIDYERNFAVSNSAIRKLLIGDYVEVLHNCTLHTKNKLRTFLKGSIFQVVHIDTKNQVIYGDDFSFSLPISSLRLHHKKTSCECSVITLNSIGCQCGVIVG